MALKSNRIDNPKHLAFIRTLPCAVTGREWDIEAAHLRAGNDGGMGMKPSDCFVVPLNQAEHARQHQIGEIKFWPSIEDTKTLALLLYKYTGNREKCLDLIQRYRMKYISYLVPL